jgi:hypothetical protein
MPPLCLPSPHATQVKKDGQQQKKRKVGDLVSGAGSSSSDECTEAQVRDAVGCWPVAINAPVEGY